MSTRVAERIETKENACWIRETTQKTAELRHGRTEFC